MQATEFRVAWNTPSRRCGERRDGRRQAEYFPVILALAASEISARGSTSSSASAMSSSTARSAMRSR